MKSKTNVANKQNTKLVNELNTFLSNYQMYYQNLRALHWLVTGNQFFTMHDKYEEWYNEAEATIDEVAERILMLNGKPMHTYEDYLVEASIKAAKNISDPATGAEVVLHNNELLLKQMREIVEYASDINDEGTIDLMSGNISAAEKRIWMLKAYLK